MTLTQIITIVSRKCMSSDLHIHIVSSLTQDQHHIGEIVERHDIKIPFEYNWE